MTETCRHKTKTIKCIYVYIYICSYSAFLGVRYKNRLGFFENRVLRRIFGIRVKR
jgi:hypothetical protein